MKKFDCPFQTPEEQVESFRKNWLDIPLEDEKIMKNFLTVVPYIHLFGYYRELKKKASGLKITRWDLYRSFTFDERLRLIFLRYIPYIERDLKSKLVKETCAYYWSDVRRAEQKYYRKVQLPNIFLQIKNAIDKYWIFYDSMEFSKEKEYDAKNKKEVLKAISAKEVEGMADLTRKYIDMYIERYNDPKYPPIWNLMEELTFWEVNIFCWELPNQVMDKITNSYDLWPRPYKSAIKNIIDLRNCCCHNNMLFNRAWQLPKELREKLSEKDYLKDWEHYYPLYYIYSLTHFFLMSINKNFAIYFINEIAQLLLETWNEYLLLPRPTTI